MNSSSVFALFFLSFGLLHADVSFITEEEYASDLYHSPRGIGCFKCHGEQGEGKLIATYKDKGEKRSFSPPAIKKLDFKSFDDAMRKRQRGMPRYFLTQLEIQTLYYYLHPEENINAD
ncbi:MAG: cytochrome c [Helicobacteraceae bacterium]|nr:cytochrome c [Helicobacteraceae bacterium]